MLEKHHILFNRHAWESNKNLASLRRNKELITPLETDTHRALHDNISHVPPLSYHMANHVLGHFLEEEYTDNPIHAIDNMQRSIELAARHPKADRLERQVAELAMDALQQQKPYVDDSGVTYYISLRRNYGTT